MKERLKHRGALALIIFSEFCERYTFYSIRSVLFTFTLEYYHLTTFQATRVVHLFVSLCYFFSVMGGVLADSVLGRYWTIMYFNMAYAAGNILLCLSSTERAPVALCAGLALISIGTGSIKPCISAFGGEQVRSARKVGAFFSVFYFFINTGSLVGVLVSPLLAALNCKKGAGCYVRAFQISAAMHLVSAVFFAAGSGLYRRSSPDSSIFRATCIRMRILLKKRFRWLYARRSFCTRKQNMFLKAPGANAFARGLQREESILSSTGVDVQSDIQMTLSILRIFAFAPFFWMLFDQQSSSWVEQGMRMDPHAVLFGRQLTILPSQMQAMNSIAVILMIPLFSHALYPLAAKAGLGLHPLKRMNVGLLLAPMSFFVSAALESILHSSKKNVSILWQIPQYIIMTAAEILVSITGLELAYTQSPVATRSLVFAAWLMSSALGNVLVLVLGAANPIMAHAGLPPQLGGQLLFCVAGTVAGLFFARASKRFVYTEQSRIDNAKKFAPNDEVANDQKNSCQRIQVRQEQNLV